MKKKVATIRRRATRSGSDGELKGFGKRLREIRERRGMTQEDVARAIGTDWMRISRYERGLHLPTADKIVSLARVLRVTTDALLLGDPEGEQPIEFNNLRLYERFRALDELPRGEHEPILRIIDAVLVKHAHESVTERSRRAS